MRRMSTANFTIMAPGLEDNKNVSSGSVAALANFLKKVKF